MRKLSNKLRSGTFNAWRRKFIDIVLQWISGLCWPVKNCHHGRNRRENAGQWNFHEWLAFDFYSMDWTYVQNLT